MLDKQIFQLRHLDIYTIFYEYSLQIIGAEIPPEISLTRPQYIAMKDVFERQCPQPIGEIFPGR